MTDLPLTTPDDAKDSARARVDDPVIRAAVDQNDLRLRPEPSPIARPSVFSVFRRDIIRGLSEWKLWTMLGWNDIQQRYRRSVLGPLWMTLSMAMLIIVLGFIYSRIFKTDIATYLPYLALGFITWGFISSSVNESCIAFQESERIIKQIRIPFSVFVLRVVWRNFIVLLHTVVLMIPITLIFHVHVGWATLLVIPGFALVYINQVWVGIVLAILCARYRDVPQIVATMIQIAIFATPIMWPISSLGSHTYIANFNPIYHFIELIRSPLLGQAPAMLSWHVALAIIMMGILFAAWILRRASNRIVYWL
jgi:ABC-type polysaccharide/polyol phosphate export permease